MHELSDCALKLIEGLSPTNGGGLNDRGMNVQLQSEGISLWNKTIALKNAGTITPQLNAQSKLYYQGLISGLILFLLVVYLLGIHEPISPVTHNSTGNTMGIML